MAAAGRGSARCHDWLSRGYQRSAQARATRKPGLPVGLARESRRLMMRDLPTGMATGKSLFSGIRGLRWPALKPKRRCHEALYARCL